LWVESGADQAFGGEVFFGDGLNLCRGNQLQLQVDYIQITPPASAERWKAASIHTYDDHRVAMCFSLATFNPAQLPVRIEDPKCVAKTFPDYFEAFLGTAVLQIQGYLHRW
jgi:3-phosphoshikimate 1-carboxyvinyltransferase